MRYLVTGGGGFLGQNLVRHLRGRGDEVVVLGRSRYPALESWGVQCVRGDVRDLGAVTHALSGVDGVFHVAAKVGYWGRYADYESVNVGGTQTLLDAARSLGVERLVYTSTPSVAIGPEGDLVGVDESTPYPKRYLSHYGPTKAEAERRVLSANGAGMATGAIRPHFIYGPGDHQVAPRIVERARRGSIARVGDGTNLVDVCYIDNVVEGHVQLMDALARPEAPAAGQAFFLGDPAPIRLWEFVARILEGFGAPPVERVISFQNAWRLGALLEGVYRLLPSSWEPPMTRMAAVILGTNHYFSHARAASCFGYAPQVETEEGLARLFRFERERAEGPRPA